MDSALALSLSFLKKHKWPILVIVLFLFASYLIIASSYNYVTGDGGIYARAAKIFCEQNKIDISYTGPIQLGQLLFVRLFSHIFGFGLTTLNFAVYAADFLFLLAMYLILSEFGFNPWLSLFGALTLLINPISFVMIDWYLTEPFFMFYLAFSIFFFIKGLRKEKLIYLYPGAFFCALAGLTRQYAVSVSVALIIVALVDRRRIKKEILVHLIISAMIPLLTIGLFYLYLHFNKSIQQVVPSAYTSANSSIFYSLTHPLHFISKLYFDSLFFLHYTALYLAPLMIVLFLSFLSKPKRVKGLNSSLLISIISILYVSTGTFILYVKNNQLMPYIANIFSISSLTSVFNFPVLNKEIASYLLTIFTWLGAVVILIKIGEYFFSPYKTCHSLNKINHQKNKINHQKAHLNNPKKVKARALAQNKDEGKQVNSLERDPAQRFLYFWGIIYLLLSSVLVLRYDRYIFPISIFMIFVVLSGFSYLGEMRKALVAVFILFFLVVVFNSAFTALHQDLQWEANYSLLKSGIPSHEINGGLGFNHFYSFDYITNLYKEIKIGRPINWYKFHPFANYIVSSKSGMEKGSPGVILFKTLTKQKFFGYLKSTYYIYRRKPGYSEPIWP